MIVENKKELLSRKIDMIQNFRSFVELNYEELYNESTEFVRSEIWYTADKNVQEKAKRLYREFTDYCMEKFKQKTKNNKTNVCFLENTERMSLSSSVAYSTFNAPAGGRVAFSSTKQCPSIALLELYPQLEVRMDESEFMKKKLYICEVKVNDVMKLLGLKGKVLFYRKVSGTQRVARYDGSQRINFGTVLVCGDQEPEVYSANPKTRTRQKEYVHFFGQWECCAGDVLKK